MPDIQVVKLRTISPVHTGDIDRKSREVKTSGIMGSLRWWYEALVRGFGAYACDPTEPDSCLFDARAYERSGDVEDGLRDVCPACRLFGCTGWSKKFKLLITDKDGNFEVKLDKPGIEFQLQFICRKPLTEEERWLLSRTIWLIAEYGSMGGRTTIKPPRFPDFGLVEVVENISSSKSYEEVAQWLSEVMENSQVLSRKLSTAPKEYPDLRFFFFNKGRWLDRKQMNELVEADKSGFMRGALGVSKKLFSFSQGKGKRFWGYTTGEEMLKVITDKLASMGITGTKLGKEVMLSEL